ncbi:MAG: hypothetical protein KJP14_06580 [Eudoraea sp.]|nr:hypothetical protein [Eudoraea sp.]
MRKIGYFFIVALGLTQLVHGQNMHVSHYSAANGLPSNEVRHVALDSLGFAWIATDAGLVRFDGIQFESYTQYVPSQYGKYLLATAEGLLLSHDAGISLIQPELDTTKISLSQKASIDPDDPLLYYPNRLFQRSNGAILVGQPGGEVHLISQGGLKQVLPRSGEEAKRGLELFFAELNEQLWIAYSDGSLYVYNETSGLLEQKAAYPVINDMKSSGNALWIASDKIYHNQLTSDSKNIRAEESFQSPPGKVSALALDTMENIYLGIQDQGLYYLDRTSGNRPEFIKVYGNNDPHTLNELPFKNIHSIVFDAEDKLWICSSEGLGILQKRFFESIGSIPNANTTAISIADNGNIFVNFGDVYRVEKTDYGYKGEQLATASLGTITALTTKGDRLWTGTSTGKLHELNQKGKRIKTIDLEERGEGIFYLAGDSRNRIWVAQAPRDKPLPGIGCVLPNGSFRDYGADYGLENRIICLRETPRGRIYASGIGRDTYLYRYLEDEDRFVNLSMPFEFYVGPNFQVHDLAVDQNGVIWLASTDGLLRHNMEQLSKVDLGPQFSNKEVKAVTASADGSIWISFDTEGVLRYTADNTIVMQEESGLPSKVMTYRCIQSDEQDRLWIGTAEGVVYTLNMNPKPGQSKKPWLISTVVDGRSTSGNTLQMYPDEELLVDISAPSFHGYRIFYQYKINDKTWSAPATEATLAISGLVPGQHTLAVRAKKEGAYLWSAPQLIDISVRQYWYKNKVLLWALAVFVLAAMVYLFWSQKRRFQLILKNLNRGLEEKEGEVIKQEADLVKFREEMRHKLRERKADLLILEIMHRLFSKIGPDTKWELVLETISLDLLKLPGVVAYEIGIHRGKHIEFEGYSEKVRGFTSAKVPFKPGISLAAYCMAQAKAFIFNNLSEESSKLLEKKDLRIAPYKAAISVPFYIKNREAILTVYADKEDLFDEYTRKAIQIFATYLEQIA